MIKMMLNRLIPNLLPMHGLKIKCSYQGVKKQCSNCYGYHKPEENYIKKHYKCMKTTFREYKETFKENNLGMPLKMTGLATKDESNVDDNNSKMDDYNGGNNDETENEDTYFN